MGSLICLACLFPFPKPSAADIDDVRHVIERTYTQDRQPWSEVAGPYARVTLLLLTPEFGIADGRVTIIGSTTFSSRSVRVTVKKIDGGWTIFHPE
jgi:hypothetical protein